jgi:hypothetical protein
LKAELLAHHHICFPLSFVLYLAGNILTKRRKGELDRTER